jgi:hypothetical protein
MALQTVSPEVIAKRRDIVLVYAEAGSGKTRLVSSLTERFGNIVYFALDEGSEGLDSVLEKYRGRIHVERPTWENPILDAAEIASRDWKQKYPEARTLVLDTFSNLTWKLLAYVSNMGMFSKNHVEIAAGTLLKQALPDRGDYGGTHSIIRNFVTQILNQQRDLNIIFVCHADLPDRDDSGNQIPGGPATVGKAMTAWLPARFKTVIRIDKEVKNTVVGGAVQQTTTLVAKTAPHGSWIARINEASEKGNPIPAVPLAVDPINFWKEYDRHFYKESA